MDVTSFQNLINPLAQMQSFTGEKDALSRQTKQKTNNFAAKLNGVIERFPTGASNRETAAQPSADMERPAVTQEGNNIVKENQTGQTADDKEAKLFNGDKDKLSEPKIPEELIAEYSANTGAMTQLILGMALPPAANVAAEQSLPFAAQNPFNAHQPNWAQFNLPQDVLGEEANLDLPLVTGSLKNELSDPKVFNALLVDANVANKGQIFSQVTIANMPLAALNQNASILQAQLQPKEPVVDLVNQNAEKTGEELLNLTLTVKEPAPQGSVNQQPAFGQTLDSEANLTQNPDQAMSNGNTFSIPADAASHTQADKTGTVDGAPKTTPDFTTPRDEFQVKMQIVEQAVLINRSAQESEMIIRLKPDHLGELALKVTVNNGVVNASFHSNNAEVRGILENSIQQLKQDLANVGFKVDNVSISTGLSQFAANQERELGWQREPQRTSGQKGEEGYAEAIDGIAAIQHGINSSKDDGVDYRI